LKAGQGLLESGKHLLGIMPLAGGGILLERLGFHEDGLLFLRPHHSQKRDSLRPLLHAGKLEELTQHLIAALHLLSAVIEPDMRIGKALELLSALLLAEQSVEGDAPGAPIGPEYHENRLPRAFRLFFAFGVNLSLIGAYLVDL